VFCSGKIAVDLSSNERRAAARSVAICRVEQLYPLPVRDMLGVIERYPSLSEVLWVQEEPENMGGWDFVRPSLEGLVGSSRLAVLARPRSSSPAEGSAARYAQTQSQLIRKALTTGADVKVEKSESRQVEK
jgi:2-oxoglutarate dehydrogenase E1 component